MKNAYKILVGKFEGKRTFGSHKRRIILKWSLKKQYVRMCTGIAWFRLGFNDGFNKHGNELRVP
jgi:hypothetical protein